LDVRTFFICENREDLYHTIDKRCVAMLLRGFLREVHELLLREELHEVCSHITYIHTYIYIIFFIHIT
jgi:tRNA A37 N6-isopentenylltransferase MiaA